MMAIPPLPDDTATWNSLLVDWHADPPIPELDKALAAMRRRVGTHRRAMVAGVVMEVLLSLGVVAGTVIALVRYPGTQSGLIAADCWLILAVVWVYAFWNRKGTWRPLADSTEAFLALSRLRCQRRLRTVWLVVAVVIGQVVIVTGMRLWVVPARQTPGVRSGWLTSPWLAAVTIGVYLAGAMWFRQRTLRELRALDQLHKAMHSSPADVSPPKAGLS